MSASLNIPRQRVFWAAGLGHLTNDTFMSMGAVVLAFLSVSILPLSNTQIGLMLSSTQLMGAVSQPGFGLLADRIGGRWLGAGGVIWTIGFFMLSLVMVQTGYFWLLFIPYVFRGVGSGAFHPAGTMLASGNNPSRSASNMAYFFLMGQLGGALGPVLAGQLLDKANPNTMRAFTSFFKPIYNGDVVFGGSIAPLFILILPAIPVIAFMAITLPNSAHHRAEKIRVEEETINNNHAAANGTTLPVKTLILFAIMVGLRSVSQNGSVAFFPKLFQAKGWSPTEYGAITSIFWIASAFAGIVFGNIADRIDRRLVIGVGLLLSAPAFFLLPVVDGSVAVLMAIAAGAFAGGSHSIIVVLAQDLLPNSKGLASGSILGFIFATGALGSLLIGILSDAVGMNTTFQLVAGAVVIAGLLAFMIPTTSNTTEEADR
jgi:MFS transporter, FSR family, fosmidomycin resistance protein